MSNRKVLVRVVFAVWVFTWLLFLARPYFKKDLIGEYGRLLLLSSEGKKARVTGEELYEFIGFANQTMEPGSSYRMIGLENDPLSGVRAAYYLYPNRTGDEPKFLLLYKTRDFPGEGWRLFKRLGPDKCILKKVE
jgi:hypothetical protein